MRSALTGLNGVAALDETMLRLLTATTPVVGDTAASAAPSRISTLPKPDVAVSRDLSIPARDGTPGHDGRHRAAVVGAGAHVIATLAAGIGAL